MKNAIYWQTAGLNIEEMNEVNKKYFDWKKKYKKYFDYELKIGDCVLWCDYSGNNKVTRKLQCRWRGPLKILWYSSSQNRGVLRA